MNDMLLTKSIPDFTSNTVSINGVSLHYLLGGNPNGPPVILWHGFLSTSYGDSDKPAGTEGYDGRALAEEFRALVREIGFGTGRPLTLVAHDMGAPPALLWAADHPEEVAGLLYIEVPVMLSEVLTKIIAYTAESMKNGSMWWWVLPLAPDVPERLIVGNERAFVTWFYERYATPDAIDTATVDEYLRTFSGREGVLGALGVYRAAFITMEQTARLTSNKVQVPIVALGGERAQGLEIRKMVEMVAEKVDGGSIVDCGHFVPEERPDELVRYVLAMLGIPAFSSS